jgi:hypothetical protein
LPLVSGPRDHRCHLAMSAFTRACDSSGVAPRASMLSSHFHPPKFVAGPEGRPRAGC